MRRPGVYVPLSAHYADDEKIMEVGEDAELMYVRMLAYAARTPRTGGWISDAVATSRLGIIERSDVPGSCPGKRLGKLAGVGLIIREGSGWRIAAWLRWNRSPEQIDRERTQDRNRKSRANTGKQPGKQPGTSTGVHSAFLGAETETETETERGERSQARATRINPDFVVTDDLRSWAVEKQLDYLDLDGITEDFVDYWLAKSGKDATKVDWDRTWQRWIRRESTNVRPMARPGPPRPADIPEGW